MAKLERDFNEFFCQLENCNEGQSQIFEDIIEAFHTYVNEILLAFNVEIGANDSINVADLLYSDFWILSEMFQSDQISEVQTFLQHLQEYERSRLCCLQRNVRLFRPSSKVERMQEFKENIKLMKKEEMADLEDFLTLSENAIEIIMKPNPNSVNEHALKDLVQNMKDHQESVNFQDEKFNVTEINKRTLGRVIVKCIGHEGIKEKEDLRRLLQSCIDYLQNEAVGVWKNASITIYDEADNAYQIVSGSGKHEFICRMEDGEPLIVDLSCPGHKKRKTSHRAQAHQFQNQPPQDNKSSCAIF